MQMTSALTAPLLPQVLPEHLYNQKTMEKNFDVIIIGGSYSGLAAGMALGRALRKVLIIDSGLPCNSQTPYSHNFLTQDGKSPAEIRHVAFQQVQKYDTIQFLNGVARKGSITETGFSIVSDSGEMFLAKKLIFATGIKDVLPDIPGYADCWGISVLHCPYCHGYEVKNEATGILGNGDAAFEFAALLSNWTRRLTILTNGKSTLTDSQTAKLAQRGISVVEDEVESLAHSGGYLQSINFRNGSTQEIKALYGRNPFTQHCPIPESLGCELTTEGYVRVNQFQKTSVPGVFACGDNAARMRTVANAVASGTSAGMMVNKELIDEIF
jgi:thioredoxin reductase